jgi:hypothetical protein
MRDRCQSENPDQWRFTSSLYRLIFREAPDVGTSSVEQDSFRPVSVVDWCGDDAPAARRSEIEEEECPVFECVLDDDETRTDGCARIIQVCPDFLVSHSLRHETDGRNTVYILGCDRLRITGARQRGNCCTNDDEKENRNTRFYQTSFIEGLVPLPLRDVTIRFNHSLNITLKIFFCSI